MAVAHTDVTIVRMRGGSMFPCVDRAATEEPLEVRLHGEPFAVIMRTPGADRELAAGFLFSEGVIASSDDLGTIAHCTESPAPAHADAAAPGRLSTTALKHPENVINVTLAGRARDRVDGVLEGRRRVMGNSSCGMCGRLTIESLTLDAGALPPGGCVTPQVMLGLPGRLRDRQATFDETGGIHAAGLFTLAGDLIGVAEDVGRHNAVDKIVGRALMQEQLPLSRAALFVSGRTSFEIVQKVFLAGIPVLGAVSAPSSLAIELAEAAGVTLLGFVRDDSFNVYTHAERIG